MSWSLGAQSPSVKVRTPYHLVNTLFLQHASCINTRVTMGVKVSNNWTLNWTLNKHSSEPTHCFACWVLPLIPWCFLPLILRTPVICCVLIQNTAYIIYSSLSTYYYTDGGYNRLTSSIDWYIDSLLKIVDEHLNVCASSQWQVRK